MKRFFLFIPLALLSHELSACAVCERQQPKLLKGVVHGAGPDSNWDYVIIWSVILITLASLYFSIKWLIRPGETHSSHIKYSILNHDAS